MIYGLLVLYIPVSFRLNKVGLTPWIKAFHQGQEKKATAIVLVAASEPADGTIFLSDAGCIIAESATLLDTTSEGNPQRAAAAG